MKTYFDRHGYCDEPAIVKVLQGGDTLPVLVLVNGCDEKIATIAASAPDLLQALEECITSEGAACFGDMENHPERMQIRLYAIADIARAAILKARGEA